MDYTQSIIEKGAEFVFAVDIPYVPIEEPVAAETQVVLSQAGESVPKHDYLLKQCAEVTMTDTLVEAFNGLEIPGMLARALENTGRAYIDIDTEATMKVTVLEYPNHGALMEWKAENGYTGYDYRSDPGFKGKDNASFFVEFEGKRYKVDVHIQVVYVVDEHTSGCDEPELIEVNPPSSWLRDTNTNTEAVYKLRSRRDQPTVTVNH